MANMFGFGPMGVDAGLQTPDQSPEAKRKLFDTLSVQHKVPANVLMAVTEDGKTDPGMAATKIAEQMAAGKKVEDIVGPQVMNRAYDLADQMYPQQQAAPATAGTLRKVGDAAVAVGQGVLDDGVVTAVRGAGELATAAVNMAVSPINAAIQGLTGTNPEWRASNPLTSPTNWASEKIQGAGDYLTSDATKQDIANSQITGDILNPSSISFGDNPSINGMAQQVVRTFGSLVPTALAAWFTGGSSLAGAGLGMASAAGDQAKASDDALDQMAKTVLPDGRTQIEAESEVYRENRAKGLSHEDAVAATKSEAAQLAAVMSAPIGMIGGAVEAKLFNPAEKILEKSGLAQRVAGRAAMGAASEGPQEAGEVTAGRVGSNMGAGTNQDLTQNTAADFILGALGGGATAGGAAAMGVHPEAPPAPAAMPPQQNTPGDGSAGGQGAVSGGEAFPGPNPGAAPARPAPPAGPISRIAATAPDLTPVPEAPPPAALFPDQKPGNAVQLLDPETGVVHDAAFLGETQDGVSVRINGEPILLTPQEFDQARNGAAKIEEEAKAAPKKAAAKTPAQPKAPAIKQGGPSEPINDDQAGIPSVEGLGKDGGGVTQNVQTPAPISQGEVGANPQERPSVQTDGQGVSPAYGATEPASALTPSARPSAEPMAAPSDRVQPDMLGGEAKTEADLAGKERRRKEWGKFLGMSENAKSAGETDLEGRTVLIRPGKVVIRARTDGASDQDFRLDTDGMTRDQISAATRGALAELDRRAPIERKPEVYQPAPARLEAPRTPQPLPGVMPEDDAATPAASQSDDPFAPVSQVSQPATSAPTIKHIREKAAVLQGVPENQPPTVGKIGFKWDKAEGGFIFSRAKEAEVRKALGLDEKVATLPGTVATSATEAEKVKRRDEVSPFSIATNAVKQSLTEDEAAEYGKKAFSDGYKRLVPPDLRKLGDSGARAWYRGWDAANLAAPEPTQGIKKPTPPLAANLPTSSGEPAPQSVPTPAEVSAAAAQADPNPTEAQKEAGNYAMGHIPWNGLDLTIETAKGSMRKGKDADGEEWSVKMPADYGYIRGTEGADGDHVDFYMGPAPDAAEVYVIDQVDADTRAFDEHKVMLGFRNRKHALDTYALGFNDGKGKDRLGAHKIMTVPEFLDWVKSGDHTKPVRLEQKAEAAKELHPGLVIKNSRTGKEKTIYTDLPNGYRAEVSENGSQLFDPQGNIVVDSTRQYTRDELAKMANGEKVDRPDAPKPQDGTWKQIGKNKRGDAVFEDERGVRSYVEKGMRVTESVRIIPGGGVSVNKADRGSDYLTADERVSPAELPKADEPEIVAVTDVYRRKHYVRKSDLNGDKAMLSTFDKDGAYKDVLLARENIKGQSSAPAAEPAQPKPLTAPGILGALSQEKQDRAAELKARLAAKARTQLSSGLDPEYITLGGELVALYIEAGTKRFGQMLRDFAESTGLTLRQAQAPMRAAYNHVRDTMDLDGEDVSDMDDGAAVMAEVRKAMAEEDAAPKGDSPVPSQTGPESDMVAETAALDTEGADEQRGNQEGDKGQPASQSPQESMDGNGQPDSGSADDGSGEGNENGSGANPDEPGAGVGSRPGSVSDGPVEARKGTAPPNFVITDNFPLGEGTDGEKLAANMAALRLVRSLESENRYATPQEQTVLARWIGWGGLKTLFDAKHEGTNSQWGKAQAELRQLLSAQEYVAAMRSTNDAHYTSRSVVKAMWRAMRNFGFDGGRALEPTIGAGNFLGLQPADLSEKTEWFAAELDPVTGLIAKHLYPQAQVFDAMGFQDAPFRRATFDVAIGNPPFGQQPIGNKKLHPDLGKMKVHNFIIAKTGQLLREGGVMSMVVTHRFLDTDNPEARAALAPEFRFLGAVRLPNTAFEANANTEVTTDIVFFQKRKQGETDGDTSWLETDKDGPNGTKLNGYFAANPDMILGRAAMDGTMYAGGRKKDGKGEFTVHNDGRDMDAALNAAIDRIEATIPTRETALEDATTARDNSSTLPYGAMMVARDGKIYRGDEDEAGNRLVTEVTAETFWRENAEAQDRVVVAIRAALKANESGDVAAQVDARQRARNAAQEAGLIDLAGDPISHSTKFEQEMASSIDNLMYASTPRPDSIKALEAYERAVERKRLGTDGFERLSSMLDLRQRTRELIALERADAPQEKLEAKRRALRRTYRLFKNKFGFLNNSKNEAVLRGDVGPEFALELHYKAANSEGGAETAKEAPILEKRVIYPHKMPEKVESIADGLHVSMQERGYIDPVLIGALTGKTTADVVAEMTVGENPLAFLNPKAGHYESAEVYLSGNLAEKIKAAGNAGLYQNIPHLKKAMPPAKEQSQIVPSIRSLWMPPDIFKDFLRAMGYPAPAVALLENVGMAAVEAGSVGGAGLSDFGRQFETPRMTPANIFEHAIKGKIPVIYDSVRNPDGGYRQVKNEEATREAVLRYEQMGREFPQWAYENPERAGKIMDAFNEKMNVVTERKYQGVRYLRMVGNSPEIDMRNSQLNGAWRMIQDKVTLLHHVVGAGKTFTAITGIMERKRMGLTRKAVVAVPNHLTAQWGREWLELYPAANILVPTEKDFEPANRAKLINRIATGDFDAVIIGHSQLTKIENDPVATELYITEQIEELESALQEERRSGQSKRTIGQIGTRLTKLTEKLNDLRGKLAEGADSRLIGWHQLGVDYLAVDEAHLFKNLEYTTTATQLVGMNPPGGSQRAFDMLMKIRSLQAMQNGGMAFLTGTPVSNSLVEIYSMMKYLVPDALKSMGIGSFDAWKSAFIQDQSRFEYTASMQLKERNIMSGMINLGPLSQLYRSFSDIVMRPDVERMFSEQMEARNVAEPDQAKHVPTRFPTPKVRGGGRRISLAPPTARMKEFVRYLVMRMAGIKQNKGNKAYLSVDNSLWVLTDARKASVDIRTIDPTLGREEGSKVDRSSAEVFKIWQDNTERRGTQMVFCDMSAPTKTAVKDANRVLKAAYEKIGLKKAALKDRIAADSGKSYAERWGGVIEDVEGMISSPATDERKRDGLVEFMESDDARDASAAMFTADTGFSFYDDMRTVLIEKGIPEGEIAFIHDYDTTAKKAQLFEAVREGRIRVLLGSTQKMGAGTNAQKRMVALHHIDAPWRPSDMEQREGRIIRQGNMFYEQDPEGFEVDIIAYSTEQTADVVQWQVLERKASSIETFMNATTDSLVEEGGDADQYAEFMAQSTGKPVFLQKMQAEKKRDNERAAIASAIRMATEADRFLRSYARDLELYQAREAAFKSFTPAIIGDGANAYLSDWQGQVAAYRAEAARVDAEAKDIRKENALLKPADRRKLPEAPKAPARWTTPPANGWERKVYDALNGLQGGIGRREAQISLGGGFSIQIQARPASGAGSVGATQYNSYLVPPDEDFLNAAVSLDDYWGTEVKDFRNSDKLLQSLSPANILQAATDRANRAARTRQQHVETLPKMTEIQARGVDMSAVTKAEEDLARLSALVRIEEVKFATESASFGENYFALRDDKGRDLVSDNTAQPMTDRVFLENAGETYVSTWGAPGGTARVPGTDRSGSVVFFEASNERTGEKVIIQAIRPANRQEDEDDSWTVQNVWDAPVEPEPAAPPAPRRKKTFEMRMEDDGGPAPMESRFDLPPVADLTGKELGAWEDIRQLGRKAAAWYRANLIGQTAINAETGMKIKFTSAGAKKLAGRKGDVLYRSVPALREILEKGALIQTVQETKGRDHIKAWHTFGARVMLDGLPRDLVAHVMETRDGNLHYDLSRDMGDGAKFMREGADTSITANRYGLEDNPVDVNLDFAEAGSKAESVPVEALKALSSNVQAEMARHGLAGKVTPRVVRGLLGASGVPIQGRQAGNVIEVNPEAADPVGVARHEIIHALRDPKLWDEPFGLFTRAEWLGLVAEAKADTELTARIDRMYRDKAPEVRAEEAVAETYRLWAQGREMAGPVMRAFAKVKAYLQAVASALRGQGFTSAALTMERIASGAVGGRGPDSGGRGNNFPSGRREIGTGTDAFKAWFGKSKIVAKDGKPLVVYHGGTEDFEAFDPANGTSGNRGIYLAPRAARASRYAERSGRDGAHVYPVYVRLENPLVVDAVGDGTLWERSLAAISPAARKALDGKLRSARKEAATKSAFLTGAEVEALKAQGYDGIVSRELDEIVAFEPTQIKSVFNGGNWNPDDPRMSEMRSDLKVETEETKHRVIFTVRDGENVAVMDAFKSEDGGLQVDVTEVPDAMQRQGVSTALHDAGIAWAERNGGIFLSGYEMTKDGRSFYDGLRQKGYSVDLIDLDNGEQAYRLGMPAAAESRFDLSLVKDKFRGMVGSRHWKNPGEYVSNLVTDAMAGKGGFSALALVPGRPLFAELGKRFVAAKAYLRGKEEMDALRNDWHAKADEVAQKWMALRDKMPEANGEMMDLMHRTTLSGIDPSRPDTWKHAMEAGAQAEIARFGPDAKEWAFKVMEQIDQHKRSYEKLRAEFTALPADFQALYPEVRANYDKLGDDFEKAVLENIANATRIGLKRAERAHRKEIERIRDEGLEGDERGEAIEAADAKLANAKRRGGFGAKARIQVLRKLFESNKLNGPYFPLARFGTYFVTIRNDKGAVTSFSRFEKEAQQQAFIRERKGEGETRIEFGTIDKSAKMRQQVNPAFVAEIENLMAESGASDEVLDAIWQRYLETLPDQSIRTSKIHRKGRSGYNTDALRAFGSHMFHGAHQLARLKYGLVLEEHLNDAEEEARISDNPNRAGLVVAEMKKRHDFAMNPKGSSAVAALSGMAFIWYLGATPAAALANISQTTVVGAPLLTARFQKAGLTGVLSALGKATKDFAAGRGQKITDTWTVENSPNLTGDERAAMAEAHRRGIIDRTQAHDLASVAETGVEYNPIREKWMKRISLFFHHAERFNREVTFLAAYRMARDEGQVPADAVQTGSDMTYKIHFDMQNTSRARFMQNDIGKILTTFRAFTVNMLWRLFRDSHQAMNGATKEERREARAQLVGVTLSLIAHAGIRGTWGYGLIMLLLGALAPGADDDDIDEWLQSALLMEGDSPGAAMWNYGMGAALNGVPGQVMGVDLTDRIGMPNLWFRGQDRDLEGADLYSAYVGDLLGPVYTVGQGFFRGAQLAADGEWWRGTEAVVPKVIRDGMKSARYLGEGAQTLNGDSLVENVNPYQALMQGIGFTPAKIAERYDINTRLKNHEKRITDRRSGLQKDAAAALTSGQGLDPGLLDQIMAFNREFPEYPITADTIRQSAQSTARAHNRQEFGVTLNVKLNDRLRADRAPAIYN